MKTKIFEWSMTEDRLIQVIFWHMQKDKYCMDEQKKPENN